MLRPWCQACWKNNSPLMLGHSCKMNSGQPKYYLFFKREPIARPNTNYLIHIVSMIKNWDIIVVGKGLTWVCQLHVHSNLHVGQQREIYYFIYIYIYRERRPTSHRRWNTILYFAPTSHLNMKVFKTLVKASIMLANSIFLWLYNRYMKVCSYAWVHVVQLTN